MAVSAALGVDKACGRVQRNKQDLLSYHFLYSRERPGPHKDRQEARLGPEVYKF